MQLACTLSQGVKESKNEILPKKARILLAKMKRPQKLLINPQLTSPLCEHIADVRVRDA